MPSISPSVCPWNFPKTISVARAAPRLGSGRRAPRRARTRCSGPVGSEARGSSASPHVARRSTPGARGRCRYPPPAGVVVALRWRNRCVVSNRAVTGRVGGGGGGPLGRAASPLALPRPGAPGGAAPSPGVPFRPPGPARSAWYAALISAIRRVASRRAAASAARSGWCSRARRLHAAFTVAWLASRSTPSTSWGSRWAIPSS